MARSAGERRRDGEWPRLGADYQERRLKPVLSLLDCLEARTSPQRALLRRSPTDGSVRPVARRDASAFICRPRHSSPVPPEAGSGYQPRRPRDTRIDPGSSELSRARRTAVRSRRAFSGERRRWTVSRRLWSSPAGSTAMSSWPRRFMITAFLDISTASRIWTRLSRA